MKKIILLVALLIFTAGCTNINNSDLDNLIKEVQSSKLKLHNQYRSGYKYYAPVDLNIKRIQNFNEIITKKETKYYMYVDLVSYYNNVKEEYKVNDDAFISKDITYKDISGYLEVNQKNDKYLIEIMYNYAKIELIVDSEDINEAITNSLIILSTINYNDDIIKNMMGDNILNFNEEQLNIFKTEGSGSNFLDYVQEYDTYEGEEIPDLDLIN